MDGPPTISHTVDDHKEHVFTENKALYNEDNVFMWNLANIEPSQLQQILQDK